MINQTIIIEIVDGGFILSYPGYESHEYDGMKQFGVTLEPYKVPVTKREVIFFPHNVVNKVEQIINEILLPLKEEENANVCSEE